MPTLFGFLGKVLLIVSAAYSLSNSIPSTPYTAPSIVSGMIKLPVRQLPEKLIIGYASWNQCDESIVQAVKDGVNVVIWFAINLSTDSEGKPKITGGPDMDCVAKIVRNIRELDLPTTHLISIGGWNAPHPDTSNPVDMVYSEWLRWNKEDVSRPSEGFYGFDGFDWDIEGNDTPSSPYNQFTVDCLDLMGQLSQRAKADGYIVSMAPAGNLSPSDSLSDMSQYPRSESYVDPTRPSFDRSLLHEYPEWSELVPGFAYHGMNVYTYLLSRYGQTKLNPSSSAIDSQPVVRTFDFVTVQLYEGYSHAEYNSSINHQSTTDYLTRWIDHISRIGWTIDYNSDPDLNYPVQDLIRIPSTELVVGLANGWAGDGKFLLWYPDQIQHAYHALESIGLAPRGFGFWNILDEGRIAPPRPNEPVWLAKGLNRILKIRKEE